MQTALSSSDSSDYFRAVRFDDECVLIPDIRPRRPFLITKSYSLPLWKRRQAPDDDQTEEPHSPVFKVPFPNFKPAKPTKASNRGREPTSPLSPCLVHKSPSSLRADGASPRRLERRSSLPSSPVLDSTGKPLPTVPLRSCCSDCVSITEECLKEGEAWVEKFSRGARRRRSSSADSDCGFTVPPSQQGPEDVSVVRLGAASSINVDEVDKRRRSRDIGEFKDSSLSNTSPSLPLLVSSAIIEEDEDQLFPLPSPRRTPNGSPAHSATGSPMPSPNASTSHLASGPGSGHSPKIPDEGILAKSFMRKGRREIGLLMLDAETQPTLSVPQEGFSSEDSAIVDSPPSISSEFPHSLPVQIPGRTFHSRSPERRRESGIKERRPSLGATVLRATEGMLKGVSLGSPANSLNHGGMSV